MPLRVLITGGAGFIGHHLCQHIVRNTEWEIVIIDKLNYASQGYDRLRDIRVTTDPFVTILSADIIQPLSEGIKKEIGKIDYIFHLAAESHVDNSITNPEPFVMSNVVGTMQMLNYAREQQDLKGFLYFSTDEVFGPADKGKAFKEWDRYNSSNPYSASKAGGEELCVAYHNTYGVPTIISHCMNNFGERQHPEKFIPMVIKKILNNENVIIHTYSGREESGSRFYIHARNSSAAALFLMEHGKRGDKYNIVGEKEVSNLEMAQMIAEIMGKDLEFKLLDFHEKRPGHDPRYALDGTKMAKMGWKLPIDFEKALEKTVRWTVDHPGWLEL